MKIQFTQYLMPDGRQREVFFESKKEHDDKVTALTEAGVSFEVEMLSTGEVSLTVEYEDLDEENITLAHEICSNGPEVTAAVETLIKEAYTSLKNI
jgi:acyl-CoA thioesterase FadM